MEGGDGSLESFDVLLSAFECMSAWFVTGGPAEDFCSHRRGVTYTEVCLTVGFSHLGIHVVGFSCDVFASACC